MDINEFCKEVKGIKGKHSINNSHGVNEAYKFFLKEVSKKPELKVDRFTFGKIIRGVNLILADKLLNGEVVVLPESMGKLELRKSETTLKFIDGKLRTNLPVNWPETMKLWYEDEEARERKTLVRYEIKEWFRVFYNKISAAYKDRDFYKWTTNRSLKRAMRTKIQDNEVDAALLY